MSSAEYGYFSRLLHRVALGSPAILRATMQMEHQKWQGHECDVDALAPVFVCGLARSGSTLLLNRLMATGAFSTSTYRHMPFVLAPNLWSGKSKQHRKAAISAERAHGDGMTHSFESEEAFEEVFWRAIGDPSKINGLLPWNLEVSAEDLNQFRRFMTSVVQAGDAGRYLSKNNNNVTRIPALLESALSARVVIPFRDPVNFAGSTLAQHRKFLDGHRANPFDAQYMAWLGHHEFGPFFKPFAAPGVVAPTEVTADYLVRYWSAVYGEVATLPGTRAVFFDYDGFCEAPTASMAALGASLGLKTTPTPPAQVHPSRRYERAGIRAETLDNACDILGALKDRATV